MGETLEQSQGIVYDILDSRKTWVIRQALEELRDDVENLNQRFRNSIFRDKVLDHDEVCTVTVDGICYGYKLHDRGQGIMEREIMVKQINGDGFQDWDQEDFDRVAVPVLETFFKEGYSDIQAEVRRGCLVYRQKFQISYLFEKNPGIVVPGKVC